MRTLVTFRWAEGDEHQDFMEVVELKPAQAYRCRMLLLKAQLREVIEADWYVGVEQTKPTPGDTFITQLRGHLGFAPVSEQDVPDCQDCGQDAGEHPLSCDEFIAILRLHGLTVRELLEA